MFERILLGALAMGAFLIVACGTSEEPDLPVSETTKDVTKDVKIGNEVGNRLPNFEITLTDSGEKLTSTGIVDRGRPAFLFFFATT